MLPAQRKRIEALASLPSDNFELMENISPEYAALYRKARSDATPFEPTPAKLAHFYGLAIGSALVSFVTFTVFGLLF